ncbi:phage/plasmid primase, P4 family [Rhizobium sp. NZLR1]|uniref:phage/plasmid primase, P4 family n=1 Tax=Rhizobium sp. NZLR1 TaxID=2731096 RepID=UPI001A9A21E8|nr:phage/plasmid primase, P4 family [Rhizobium sp. NZLR1]MBX5202232.1 hypothetical protein [Rhizobium sp. NZLR1]QSZ20854.1 hypothetical protein J3O30_21605 [Rhizobium sp. NZLR1]
MSTLTSEDDLGFLDDIAEPAVDAPGSRLRSPESLPDHIRAEYERVNLPAPPLAAPPEVRGSFEDYESSHETVINDDALALELGQKHWDENAKFVSALGQWYFWRGSRWEDADYPVTRGQVRDFLRMKADEVFEWAQRQALESNEDKAKSISAAAAKLRRTLGAHSTVTAVEQMARSNAKSIAYADDFDGDTLLLGTPGGTVDLKTGKLRPARREDMITKFTAVSPAPAGTPAKVWFEFLCRVFPGEDGRGDLETIAFIQRAAGYALTGETTEQKLLFLYGTGRNGKGTIMQTLTGILGEYSRTVSSSLFMATHGQEHPTGLAQLKGARLVASNEIPKGATWNEEVIKSLTGGDTISARLMRQDFFEFQPQLSLFISGNNKPRFKGVGVSMRERFILVPFTRNFTDENGKRDPHLGDKLKAEWPAILRWCIDGAGEWLKMGLAPPESVKAASADYLDEEDDILAFVRDCLVLDKDARTATADIYPAFRKWQEEQGVKSPWTQTAMSRALGEEGNLELKRTRPSGGGSVVNCVIGYRLKINPDAYSSYSDIE